MADSVDLLDGVVHGDDETADSTHDQIQIRAILIRKEGVISHSIHLSEGSFLEIQGKHVSRSIKVEWMYRLAPAVQTQRNVVKKILISPHQMSTPT